MEYGLTPKIDQFSDNKSLEIQKVQSSTKSSETKSKDELKQIQEAAITKEKEISEPKKVERGNAENQYPTEDMMKIKAYLLNQDSAS